MNTDQKPKNSVPFDHSYWVVSGKFLAGCYRGSTNQDEAHHKLRALIDHGIRHFINLMEPDERGWGGKPFNSYEKQVESIAASTGHKVTFDRMPIKNTWVPTRVEMCQILDRIDQSIEAEKLVYVHCWGGRGRTGTVVGCFLRRHGLSSDQDVLVRIQELRQNTPDYYIQSPETPQQIDMVLSWVEGE